MHLFLINLFIYVCIIYSIEILSYLPSIFLFNYHLQQNQVVLEGLAHIQHQSGVPLAGLSTWGDLTLNQRHPLPSTGIYNIYDIPAFPTSISSAADWRLDTILADYWERNSK